MTKEVGTHENADRDVLQLIHDVVHVGSAYDIEGMEQLYTADQSFLILGSDGTATRVGRDESIGEFAARGAAGEAPLSTEHRILHVERQGEHATALLFRRMHADHPPALYELRMRVDDNRWKVCGETVTPWPEGVAGNFIPPRTR